VGRANTLSALPVTPAGSKKAVDLLGVAVGRAGLERNPGVGQVKHARYHQLRGKHVEVFEGVHALVAAQRAAQRKVVVQGLVEEQQQVGVAFNGLNRFAPERAEGVALRAEGPAAFPEFVLVIHLRTALHRQPRQQLVREGDWYERVMFPIRRSTSWPLVFSYTLKYGLSW